MIIYPFLLFGIMLLGFGLQEFLPILGAYFYDARILLLLTLYLGAATILAYPSVLVLAFIFGILTDLRNFVPVEVMDRSSDLGFGHSILLFGLLGSAMQGVRPFFTKGRWELPILMMGLSVFAYQIVEFLLLNFKRGGFELPFALVWRMAISSGISMLMAPLIFYGFRKLAKATHYDWSFDDHQRRFQPL